VNLTINTDVLLLEAALGQTDQPIKAIGLLTKDMDWENMSMEMETYMKDAGSTMLNTVTVNLPCRMETQLSVLGLTTD